MKETAEEQKKNLKNDLRRTAIWTEQKSYLTVPAILEKTRNQVTVLVLLGGVHLRTNYMGIMLEPLCACGLHLSMDMQTNAAMINVENLLPTEQALVPLIMFPEQCGRILDIMLLICSLLIGQKSLTEEHGGAGAMHIC